MGRHGKLLGVARRVLLALPFLTVAVIVFALFVVGAARPYTVARLRGGPTDVNQPLSLRVEIASRLDETEQPRAGSLVALRAERGGTSAQAHAKTDDEGRAELVLDAGLPGHGPVRVVVLVEGVERAQGTIELDVERWRSRARERGGFLPGDARGALSLRVAPLAGALAVGVAGELWIEAAGPSGPASGARFSLRAEGFEPREATLAGDAHGRARIRIVPLDPNGSLQLSARLTSPVPGAEPLEGEWRAMPLVVSSAIGAMRRDTTLELHSPVPRDRAYVSFVSDRARIGGAIVPLGADAKGGASGSVPLPSDARLRWAVVSGEPELESLGTVGWPVSPGPLVTPPKSVAIPDSLLFDGARDAHRIDAARRRRARWLAAGFTLGAMLLAAGLVLRDLRRGEQALAAAGDEHPELSEASGTAPARVALALGVVLLGFSLVALFALAQLR